MSAQTDSRGYNGTTSSSAAPTVTSGNIFSGDSLTGLSQSFASKNVLGTNASTLNVSGYTLNDGNSGANYNVTLASSSGTIAKANATVTANSGTGSYSGLSQSVTGFTATGLVNGETSSVLTGVSASGSGINAGSYDVVAAGSDQNYKLTLNNGTLAIGKARLTITADNQSRPYGDTSSTLTTTVTGFKNSETTATAAGFSGAGSATTLAGPTTGVGTAAITAGAGTLAATNYDFTTLIDGTLDITARPLTITANALSKTYGDVDPSLTYMVGATATGTGLTNGDRLSGTLTRVAGETVAGGPYAINQDSLAAGSNYLVSYTSAKLAINPATFYYVATPTSRNYGEDNPVFTGTLSGYKFNDTLADVATGTAIFDSPAANTTAPGPCPIDGSGLVLTKGNYLLAQAPGNATALTISSAPQPSTSNIPAVSNTVAEAIQPVLAVTNSALPPPVPTTTTEPTNPAAASTDSSTNSSPTKPVIKTVIVGNTTLQKPADQVIKVEQPKSHLLVCRGA